MTDCVGRWRTVLEGEGRCGHDDGRSVTFSHDDLKTVTGRKGTVTGQNHNFYSSFKPKTETIKCHHTRANKIAHYFSLNPYEKKLKLRKVKSFANSRTSWSYCLFVFHIWNAFQRFWKKNFHSKLLFKTSFFFLKHRNFIRDFSFEI